MSQSEELRAESTAGVVAGVVVLAVLIYLFTQRNEDSDGVPASAWAA